VCAGAGEELESACRRWAAAWCCCWLGVSQHSASHTSRLGLMGVKGSVGRRMRPSGFLNGESNPCGDAYLLFSRCSTSSSEQSAGDSSVPSLQSTRGKLRMGIASLSKPQSHWRTVKGRRHRMSALVAETEPHSTMLRTGWRSAAACDSEVPAEHRDSLALPPAAARPSQRARRRPNERGAHALLRMSAALRRHELMAVSIGLEGVWKFPPQEREAKL
jgi:hypothetical protein